MREIEVKYFQLFYQLQRFLATKSEIRKMALLNKKSKDQRHSETPDDDTHSVSGVHRTSQGKNKEVLKSKPVRLEGLYSSKTKSSEFPLSILPTGKEPHVDKVKGEGPSLWNLSDEFKKQNKESLDLV